MTVGERIRQARKAAGLTQKALGKACGIAEPTIRRYELGKLNPKYETLEKIAKPLNVSAAALWGSEPLSQESVIRNLVSEAEYERLMQKEFFGEDAFPSRLEKLAAYAKENSLTVGEREAFETDIAIGRASRLLSCLGLEPIHSEDDDRTLYRNGRTGKVYEVCTEDAVLNLILDLISYTQVRIQQFFSEQREVPPEDMKKEE